MVENVSSKRIAKNTIMLYFRQAVIMFVSLYTVRIVLQVLGAEDYGVYNVIAGVVSLFSFIAGTMATATQRYFSYDLGKGDQEHLQKTFSVTFQIYLILILVVLLLTETIGLWFVRNKLVIPENRLHSAIVVFHFSIATFVVSLITSPYMALIVSHEKMNVYAYVSLLEALLKIVMVVLLKYIVIDKLVLYSFLLFSISCLITSIYRFYCRKHFPESKLKVIKDFEYLKEIISYSGWNLFGSIAYVIKTQGLNILLNLYFGTLVNAAKGIATQVDNAVISFANNFATAMNPQIVKTYAADEKEKSIEIVYWGSKCCYFLVLIFALPLILEMSYVMKIWLKNPPQFAVLFTQLTLLDAMFESINNPSKTLIQATGKIKWYQIIVGGTKILLLPICLSFFAMGASAYYSYVVSIVITIISSFLRYIMIGKVTEFPISVFLKKVYFPCIFVSITSGIVPFIIRFYLDESFLRFLIVGFSSVIFSVLCMFFIGFNKGERELIFSKIKEKVQNVNRRN